MTGRRPRAARRGPTVAQAALFGAAVLMSAPWALAFLAVSVPLVVAIRPWPYHRAERRRGDGPRNV